jgi:two-component system cell cycle sensor histidine kinase/response regulator CckA
VNLHTTPNHPRPKFALIRVHLRLLPSRRRVTTSSNQEYFLKNEMSHQIHHMQRLQLAGTLASGIAHDLNDQLTLVLGNLELALDRLPASFDAYDSLDLAKTAASRCADMSRRLLYLGRESHTPLRSMDVAASVAEARLLLECIKPAHIRLTADCETGLFILGDATQIQQVLINLGTNAFYAMKNGGDLNLLAYRIEDRVHLRVADTGCGIPKSQRQRIFQPFFTTRAETGGSGLGLASVKSIVANHHGCIEFDSIPDVGTTFDLNFPAMESEPSSGS